MNKLLHIIATPRGDQSRTLRISSEFLGTLKKKYPDLDTEDLDLFADPLPSLTLPQVDGKYILLSGKELDGEHKKSWEVIVRYIAQFLSADTYLISTPFWNFSIPYVLKQYIDLIVQPKYLFQYTANGPEGLAKDKKMLVVSSRGGDYSPGSPLHAYDHQEGYLRTVFGFVGIEDISFINAQPMDAGGSQTREAKITAAIETARTIASGM